MWKSSSETTMALKRNVTKLAIYVALMPMAAVALEARGQSPVLMQVASASARSPPSAAFFADEVTGSSTADRISEAVRAGQRRTSISEVEAVHEVPHSRDATSGKKPKDADFHLLNFDELKLDHLKEVSSKVMSLVAEGARAAAESVAPTRTMEKQQPSPVRKVQKKAPSALSLLGQMRKAKVSTLQSNSRTGTDTSKTSGTSTKESTRESNSGTQPLQPQRLHSKPVAYDEATAEQEAQRRHEEEAREEHAKMEDLMDEVRNRRSW